MTDGLKHRRRLGIELKLTDRCNQSCRHCMNADGEAAGVELDPQWILSALRDWAQRPMHPDHVIDEIRMTGGEPLLCMPSVLSIAYRLFGFVL